MYGFCCICRCCRIYLVHCDDVIAALERVVKVAIPEIVEGGRDTCSNTLPILTKYARHMLDQVHPTKLLLEQGFSRRFTFPLFYRLCLTELNNCAKNIGSGKKSDSSDVRSLQVSQQVLAVV